MTSARALSAMTFDFGCEHDNYHGFYRYAEIDDGDLDYYLFLGPRIRDVVRRRRDARSPEVTVDLSTLEPQIAVPPRVDQVVDISEAVGQPIDVTYYRTDILGQVSNPLYIFTWDFWALHRG